MAASTSTVPLIIPVENQVRELDPKLLLACIAARRGFTSYIGFPPGDSFSNHRIPSGRLSFQKRHRRQRFDVSDHAQTGSCHRRLGRRGPGSPAGRDLLFAPPLPRSHAKCRALFRLGRKQCRFVAPLSAPAAECQYSCQRKSAQRSAATERCTPITATRSPQSARATAILSW